MIHELDILPARAEHVAAIVRLLGTDFLGATRETLDPDSFWIYEEAFARVLACPATTVYVALIDGQLVGTFQLTITPGIALQGAVRATVESVHVDQSLRSRGLGSAMMRFAIDEARRRGAHVMQLSSNKDRKDAHRFYERLGFAKSHEGFKLKL